MKLSEIPRLITIYCAFIVGFTFGSITLLAFWAYFTYIKKEETEFWAIYENLW